MMDDDADPLLNDCLISDALQRPSSPGLPNVYVLDVMSEFNSDFGLTDFKPMFGYSNGACSEIPLDVSFLDNNNSKDHCYISDSASSSSLKMSMSSTNHHQYKPYVKVEPDTSYCSPSSMLMPLNRVQKEICVKSDVYSTMKPTTLLMANVASPQNLTVITRQRSDDWSQASESPGALSPDDYSDSSNGGSEYFTSSPTPSGILVNSSSSASSVSNGGSNSRNVNFSVRTRSKMQELALQQKLITNQDIRADGQLHLSSEERRTLIQEGYTIPTCLPLTKKDEEALKLVRRKIKNKLSAQESRRRRKEYIDALEKRLHNFEAENNNLKRRLENLEQSNQSLVGQLRKLQSTVGRSPGQAGTGVTLTLSNFVVKSQHSSMSELPNEHSEHPILVNSRVLSANECEIPYSLGFFKEHFKNEEGGCEEFPKIDVVGFVDGVRRINGGPPPSGFNNLSDDDVGKTRNGVLSTNSNCHVASVAADT